MITASIIAPHQSKGAVLKSGMFPGQWGILASGVVDANSGEPYMRPIASSGEATNLGGRAFPFKFNSVFVEDEFTYTDTVAVPANTRVVTYQGKGIRIEDDYLSTRIGDTTFTGAAIGDLMYLNASGYPACGTGSGIGTTAVAVFLGYDGTIVKYETL